MDLKGEKVMRKWNFRTVEMRKGCMEMMCCRSMCCGMRCCYG